MPFSQLGRLARTLLFQLQLLFFLPGCVFSKVLNIIAKYTALVWFYICSAVQGIMETAMLSNLGTPGPSEQHFPLWGVALLCRLSNLWCNSTTYAINRCSLSERVSESVHLQFWALTWSVCDWLKKWMFTLDNPAFPSLPFPPPEETTIQVFH